MKLLATAAITLGFSVSAFGQLPSPPDAPLDESQCGPTIDWQDVERYDGTLGPSISFVNNNESPVGMIRWNTGLSGRYSNDGNVSGQHWCTGTLIGDNIFLTAGHCFDVKANDGSGWDFPVDDDTGDEISPYEAATNMNVLFNYQLDGGGAQSFKVRDLLEYRHGGLDYAVLLLDGNPAASYGAQDMDYYQPATGQELTIIQHPGGNYKKIEAGNAAGIYSTNYVRYSDLDTIGGSSGSGVLDSSGQIVAVHTNGGCGATGGSNRGVMISKIRLVSPIVDQLVIDPYTDPLYWTSWLDRDNYSGSGDYENKSGFTASQVCEFPTSIRARIGYSSSTFTPYEEHPQNLAHFSKQSGLACVNADQSGNCSDYHVQFLCPEGEWTPWLDRDNASGSGDYENRSGFTAAQVCSNPTDIRARVVGTTKVYTPDATMPDSLAYFSANSGLACVNSSQSDGTCSDYEVKFLCP